MARVTNSKSQGARLHFRSPAPPVLPHASTRLLNPFPNTSCACTMMSVGFVDVTAELDELRPDDGIDNTCF